MSSTTVPAPEALAPMSGKREPRPAFACDVCGKRIRPSGRASVYVRREERRAYPQALEEWKQRNAAGLARGVLWGSAYLDYPKQATWHVVHDRCVDIEAETGEYWFSVNQIDTWGKVANWTAHLMGKGWFDHTDWVGFLRRVGVHGINTEAEYAA